MADPHNLMWISHEAGITEQDDRGWAATNCREPGLAGCSLDEREGDSLWHGTRGKTEVITFFPSVGFSLCLRFSVFALECRKPLQASGEGLWHLWPRADTNTAFSTVHRRPGYLWTEPPFKSFSWNPKPFLRFPYSLKTACLMNVSWPLAHFCLGIHLIILTSPWLWTSRSKRKLEINRFFDTRRTQLVHSFFLDYGGYLWGLSDPL